MSGITEPISPYTKLQKIGKGSFGEVYKGINKASGEVIAIKIIQLDSADSIDDDLSEIQKEVHVLSSITGSSLQIVGSDLWIVMDYAGGGSVRNLLKMGPLSDRHIGHITTGVCYALAYLHHIGIIHRDIKCANILLNEEGCVKLCDFGVAGQVAMKSLKRYSFVGSPYWMSPEVIRRSAYNFKADVWSLGITIYEMATGNPPYADQDPMKAVFLIPRNPPAQLEGSKFSKYIKEFVSLCLNDDPEERLSAEELLKSKFLKPYSKRKPSTAQLTTAQNPLVNQDLIELLQSYRKFTDDNGDSDDDDLFKKDSTDDLCKDDAFEDEWTFDTVKSSKMEQQASTIPNVDIGTVKNIQPVSGKSGIRNQSVSLSKGQPVTEQLVRKRSLSLDSAPQPPGPLTDLIKEKLELAIQEDTVSDVSTLKPQVDQEVSLGVALPPQVAVFHQAAAESASQSEAGSSSLEDSMLDSATKSVRHQSKDDSDILQASLIDEDDQIPIADLARMNFSSTPKQANKARMPSAFRKEVILQSNQGQRSFSTGSPSLTQQRMSENKPTNQRVSSLQVPLHYQPKQISRSNNQSMSFGLQREANSDLASYKPPRIDKIQSIYDKETATEMFQKAFEESERWLAALRDVFDGKLGSD